MTSNEPDRVAAETWFLSRGLPAVLTPRARWRRLWRRSAPMLAGSAMLVVCLAIIAAAADGHPIDIDEDPTPAELVIIAMLLLVIPVTFVAGWLVGARVTSPRGRRNASTIAVLAALIVAAVHGSLGERAEGVLTTVVLVLAVLIGNGLGVGSVLGWAIRLTASGLASTGRLVTRALPVVLLSVLVFFNTYVWSMAKTISRDRLWLVIAFMALIAGAFLISGVLERLRPMLAASTSSRETDAARLADSPFAAMPDPITGDRLSRGERANAVFVVVASQTIQVAMVAIVTAAIFLVLGLIVLSPELLAAWTNGGPDQGSILGIVLPIPQALLHVTMFLGALTFMYVSARAVGDGEYRREFLDPLIDDLRLTLVARNRYRAHVYG